MRGGVMLKVVSFSGGRTSAYLAWLISREDKKAKFVFMDTGAEHPKTYEFIRNVAGYFNIDLVCLRADFNQPLGVGHTYKIISIDDIGPDLGPYAAMVKKYGTPSHAGKWCTSRLKQEIHDMYCDDIYGKDGYQTWIGIRADEPKRLNQVGKSERVKYLAEISDFDKQDILSWWASQPFDLEIDEWLGNCVFCFKKSELKLAAAQRDEPELYRQWLDMIDVAKERPEQDRASRHVMYRGRRTLPQLIATFDGATGAEIKARLRGAKMMDAGSCSESCEVFSCQLDMFSEWR